MTGASTIQGLDEPEFQAAINELFTGNRNFCRRLLTIEDLPSIEREVKLICITP